MDSLEANVHWRQIKLLYACVNSYVQLISIKINPNSEDINYEYVMF